MTTKTHCDGCGKEIVDSSGYQVGLVRRQGSGVVQLHKGEEADLHADAVCLVQWALARATVHADGYVPEGSYRTQLFDALGLMDQRLKDLTT